MGTTENEQVQETHFPYNASLANLLCDKPENKQSQSQSQSPAISRNVTSPKLELDIRALSPTDTTIIPLMSPEPDSTMLASEVSSATMMATDTSQTLMGDQEDERTISACSTLEGEDEIQSDTESLL